MFLAEQREEIIKKFNERLPKFRSKKEEILEGLSKCEENQRLLMQFLYGTMPLSDSGDYNFGLFLSFVDHALYLRQEVEWCKSLPEPIFLDHVLYYRINNEDIVACRKFFYDKLKDCVLKKTVKEAILEVNYWCLEQATYQAADERTASPLTVYRGGKGRCGEESTFTVTVLRSLGIPARQVYTPRWAHCDDNHAWVEVWCEGEWHFLGACEPEPVLNKGWFTNASSRAMLIHSRSFTGIGEGEVISKEGMLTLINNVGLYAKTKQVAIYIVDENGQALEGIEVHIEILNMAEFAPIATLITDVNGQVSLTLGLGDIHIRVAKEGKFAEGIITKEQTELTLVLKERNDVKEVWEAFNIIAPVDFSMHPLVLTDEQKVEKEERIDHANKLREMRLLGYYNETKVKKYPEMKAILEASKGNFDEVYAFLSQDEDILRQEVLKVLTDKDYRDLKANILEEHLSFSKAYEEVYTRETFVNYIVSPRIHFENLTCYRAFILEFFTEDEKESFKQDPRKIWAYIQSEISYSIDEDYASLCISPVAALTLKWASPVSQKILFVAICRTLGIPARINKVNLAAEYLVNNQFSNIEINTEEKMKLTLRVADESEWTYFQTFTIGVLKNGAYETLDFTSAKWKDKEMVLDLEAGEYRIITVNRMPNGNLFTNKYLLTIRQGESQTVELKLRDAKIADMLESNELQDFNLYDETGNKVAARDLAEGQKSIFVWIEEGKEPTEHILNEMIASAGAFNEIDSQIIFILRSKTALQNATLAKTLGLIPKVKLYYDDFKENINTIGRRMYVDPDKLPLVVVMNKGLTGVYACSGYNVGVAELLIKIVKAI